METNNLYLWQVKEMLNFYKKVKHFQKELEYEDGEPAWLTPLRECERGELQQVIDNCVETIVQWLDTYFWSEDQQEEIKKKYEEAEKKHCDIDGDNVNANAVYVPSKDGSGGRTILTGWDEI